MSEMDAVIGLRRAATGLTAVIRLGAINLSDNRVGGCTYLSGGGGLI